jgi:hypothetical protein
MPGMGGLSVRRVDGHQEGMAQEHVPRPAGGQRCLRHRAPDGDISVGDERLHFTRAEHGPRIAAAPTLPPSNSGAQRRRGGAGQTTGYIANRI